MHLIVHYDSIIIPLLFPEKFTVGVAVFAGAKTAKSLAYAAEAPLRSSWYYFYRVLISSAIVILKGLYKALMSWICMYIIPPILLTLIRT
jgi:hypothetical protein